MIRSFHSEVLRTYKVFNIFLVQETIFLSNFKELRRYILDSEFNYFMESLTTNESFLFTFTYNVERQLLELSLWPFSPKGFEPVTIFDIMFRHVRSVCLFIITFYKISKPMSVIFFKGLKSREFFKIVNYSIGLKLKKH